MYSFLDMQEDPVKNGVNDDSSGKILMYTYFCSQPLYLQKTLRLIHPLESPCLSCSLLLINMYGPNMDYIVTDYISVFFPLQSASTSVNGDNFSGEAVLLKLALQ